MSEFFRRRRGLVVAVALAALVSCTQSGVELVTPAATVDTSAIAPPVGTPRATPAPTSTLMATPAPLPTVDEGSAVAAFERYVALAFEARTRSPSPEALDVESYATETLVLDFRATLVDEVEQGIYWDGATTVRVDGVSIGADRAIIVNGCIATNLTKYNRDGGSILEVEGDIEFTSRAQVVSTPLGWRVSAIEVVQQRCTPSTGE